MWMIFYSSLVSDYVALTPECLRLTFVATTILTPGANLQE